MIENELRSYRWAGAVVIGFVMLVAIVAIHVVYNASQEHIQQARQQQSLAILDTVMPRAHDNDMASDSIVWETERFFDRAQSFRIYRARHHDQPAGIVMMPITVGGYNGLIKMAVGIDPAGRITGVNILSHHETPGLGAAIDQSRSDWLQQFRGQTSEPSTGTDWRLTQQGGDFDGLSGATITSTAVLQGLQAALQFYVANKQAVYRQAR